MPAPDLWSFIFRWGIYDAFMPVNYDRSLAAAFAALAPPATGVILDAGCGTGRLLVHARPWLAGGGRLVAVDSNARGLAFARRRARRLGVESHVLFHLGDVRRLTDLGLPAFDGVLAHFSVNTLPTDADRRLALMQLASVLRPGGRCVVAVPSESYRVHDVMADADRIEKERRDVAAWVRVARRHIVHPLTRIGLRRLERALHRGQVHGYAADEIREHLSRAGFRAVRLEPAYGGCAYRTTGQMAEDPRGGRI